MLTSLFWTVAGLIGAGGGFWIAALFVPSIAVAFRATVDFLRSPLGAALAIIALGFVLFASGYVSGDIHGTDATRAEWKAANAKAAEAKAANEARIKSIMVAEADRSIVSLDLFFQSLDAKVKNYADHKPGDALSCRRATRDDIRRLLDIQ
ncbi:MAG: hypothetical protein OJF48_003385 [Afipia sp.]|jgi:hypothetical protein|nr:MAG: hypothetical protein OJF48_003385 [Afipia sp.]